MSDLYAFPCDMAAVFVFSNFLLNTCVPTMFGATLERGSCPSGVLSPCAL